MLYFHIALSFYKTFVRQLFYYFDYAGLLSFLFKSKFAEDITSVMLDRIRRVLFHTKSLSWLFKHSRTKFLCSYKKPLLQIILLCPFFEVENENEPIDIKIHKCS